MIVVDANVIVAFVTVHEFTGLARAAALREEWTAPILWRSEVRSALARLMRARRIRLEDAQAVYKRAEMKMWKDCSVRAEKVLEYCAHSACSAYDCEYVVLAEDLGLRLVTLDEPLIKHFPKTALHLRDYAAETA
jgi:predicted nucleic acid-binding protein